MIDVVFLLIVFFLVATTFQKLEREMEVSVPKSDTGRQIDESRDPIVVNILDDGRVVVGGEVLELEDLQAMLAREVAVRQETKALIRAHSKLPFQSVVDVANACRKAQAKVSFATLKKTD